MLAIFVNHEVLPRPQVSSSLWSYESHMFMASPWGSLPTLEDVARLTIVLVFRHRNTIWVVLEGEGEVK